MLFGGPQDAVITDAKSAGFRTRRCPLGDGARKHVTLSTVADCVYLASRVAASGGGLSPEFREEPKKGGSELYVAQGHRHFRYFFSGNTTVNTRSGTRLRTRRACRSTP